MARNRVIGVFVAVVVPSRPLVTASPPTTCTTRRIPRTSGELLFLLALKFSSFEATLNAATFPLAAGLDYSS